MNASPTFSVSEVSLKLGATSLHLRSGVVTRVTPVVLALPYCGWPAGTLLGRVQARTRGKLPQESATFSESSGAVLGHDYPWLVRMFKEGPCGERQARLGRIRPRARYRVSRMFGFLAHDPCLYEAGVELAVQQAGDTIVTLVSGYGKQPYSVSWPRAAFESCVETFALREIPSGEACETPQPIPSTSWGVSRSLGSVGRPAG